MSRTTVTVLAGVLALLLGAAFLAHRAGQPGKPGATPLSDVPADDIVQINVALGGSTTTVKRVDGAWRVTVPMEDRADATAVERMIDMLSRHTLGTVLSENPARHGQYEVNEASATRLQVFVKGKDDPMLDYYVGKSAADIESSYIRLYGSPQVRTADSLTSYLLFRNPEALRARDVLPDDPESVDSIRASGAGLDVLVTRSTEGWTSARSGARVPADATQVLVSALRAWRAARILPTDAAGRNFGFEKPLLVLETRRGGSSLTAAVGNLVPGETHPARYVKTTDRPAILVVADAETQAIVEALKKLP